MFFAWQFQLLFSVHFLQNSNAKLHKIVWRHYSGEMENVYITAWQIYRTVHANFYQTGPGFVEDMTKIILVCFFRFTVYLHTYLLIGLHLACNVPVLKHHEVRNGQQTGVTRPRNVQSTRCPAARAVPCPICEFACSRVVLLHAFRSSPSFSSSSFYLFRTALETCTTCF